MATVGSFRLGTLVGSSPQIVAPGPVKVHNVNLEAGDNSGRTTPAQSQSDVFGYLTEVPRILAGTCDFMIVDARDTFMWRLSELVLILGIGGLGAGFDAGVRQHRGR